MKTRFTNSAITGFSKVLAMLFLWVISGPVSAQLPCDAHFLILPDTGKLTVLFTSAPNLPRSSYAWTFGDGATSVAKNPVHAYSAPGMYYVCLTVHDSAICKASYCDSVRVFGPPPPPPLCDAHFAFFRDSSQNGVHFAAAPNSKRATYAWTFGDGGTGSGSNPTHIYAAPGAYNVCLTVNDSTLCTAMQCDSIHINPPPPPPCSAKFRSLNGGLRGEVQFASNPNPPGTSYSWNFGDGTSSRLRNPNHTYANAGTYYACLTVNDSVNHQLVCSDARCDSVHVVIHARVAHCDAHFFIVPDSGKFNFRFLHAYNNRATTYSWDFGDGFTSTAPNPLHAFADSGIYNVCLTVTDSIFCTQTKCDSIRAGMHHPKRLAESDPVNGATASVYPNPILENAVIHIENATGAVSFKMYDLTGRVALVMNNLSTGDFELVRKDIPAGIYYYEVNDNNAVFAKGKLIIQ